MTNNELGDQINDNIRERRQRQIADLRYRLSREEQALTRRQDDFDEAEEQLEIATVDLRQTRQRVEDLTDMLEILEHNL